MTDQFEFGFNIPKGFRCPNCGARYRKRPYQCTTCLMVFGSDGVPQDGVEAGRAAGHESAERAAKHAGAIWREQAYARFLDYRSTHQQFTTEQVRLANPDLPEPPDNRAWGQVALRAKRAGIVRFVRWTPCRTASNHAGMICLWERV